ncbi:DUF4856 domain-containing protein [Emticicia agri]|uniref:DUF4856 domain-containing protein n=1 Tax=Emticicia agri TaxID=2492393 RepID=A0A4Q5LTD2_9BACT|nr:DUF4856 domain-containing protein [Emticicia agri]RYU92699.1 DUF4856 domain-containing protein [Emticicia agri]
MFKRFGKTQLITLSVIVASISACKDDEVAPPLRTSIDYAKVTSTTPYKSLFVAANGDSTVDLTSGNNRYKIYQALNYYLGSAVRENKAIEAAVMKNMYANTGNPFTDVPSLNISGSVLNASGVQLRSLTASSKSAAEAEVERAKLEAAFAQMAEASKSVGATASKGVAGKAGTYLLDAQGIEIAQIIQKSLIGAYQLDYIGNVLLNKGLEADNTMLVSGKKYSQLEHNWDEAYASLTLNPVYLAGSTDAVRGTSESFLGSYLWEYNKANYAKIHPAFLRGRVAIVNNDMAEVKTQATFIRTEMEKAIASAAIGYLGKWKTGTTDAARAHAIGEGLGFIYSLRYCTINGADANFSDAILNGLVGSAGGYWDLTNDKVNAAADAITAKFKLNN